LSKHPSNAFLASQPQAQWALPVLLARLGLSALLATLVPLVLKESKERQAQLVRKESKARLARLVLKESKARLV
jgi:hypothetical protein